MAAFTARSKLGRILRNGEAARILLDALPELAGSEHLDMVKGISIEQIAGYTKRDEAWVAVLVEQLAGIEDVPVGPTGYVEVRADYEGAEVAAASATCTVPAEVTRWSTLELRFDGPSHGNPFVDVVLDATFELGERVLRRPGFYDGDGTYRIRFLADAEGTWRFRTASNARSLDGIEGSFACGPPADGARGPVAVAVAGSFHFAYADGTPYRPVGTTCYAWTHQGDELEERTLRSLAASPFNKVRMCVLPKSYLYNEDEPERHAFARLDGGSFDLTRFDLAFFRHLERRVDDLGTLGIEADLILFHPYDRWGYADLPPAVDDRYVRYVVARLGGHPNVWWSLANEYDLLWAKVPDDWERLGRLVAELDPHHLRSVHHCFEPFDHARPWVSHCSMQRVDLYRTAENTTEWRERWGKPVVIDECGYEGDIDMTWGNLTAEELVRRCWEGATRGGYVGHGETYLDPDDVLWWSKGGELRGASPARIAFLRSILDDGPAGLEPVTGLGYADYPTAGLEGSYYLQYLGFFQPRSRGLELPAGGRFRVEVIDTWNMTIDDAGLHEGTCRIDLPGRPYLALRIRQV